MSAREVAFFIVVAVTIKAFDIAGGVFGWIAGVVTWFLIGWALVDIYDAINRRRS